MSYQISVVYQELPEDSLNEPNSPILTLDRTPLDRTTSRFVNDLACLTRREWVLTWMLSATGRLHIPEDLREEYQWVEIEPGFMLRLNAALRYFRGIDCLETRIKVIVEHMEATRSLVLQLVRKFLHDSAQHDDDTGQPLSVT